VDHFGEEAYLTVVDENTICVEHDGKCKYFDIHDALSPLYMKQYMHENNIKNTQCYLSSDDQQNILNVFMKNAIALFEGMDTESSFYLH